MVRFPVIDELGQGTQIVGVGALPHSVESISSLAVRQLIFVSTTGNDANDGRNWTLAKATVAAAVTALGSTPGAVVCGYGTFDVGSGVTLASDKQGIIGMARGVTVLSLNTNGTAVTLAANRNVLDKLTVSLGSSATTATGIDLHGCFEAECDVHVTGQSTGGVGSFTGQAGVTTTNNAGDNWVRGTISNCGVGLNPQSAYNFFDCLFANNVEHVKGGTPGSSFAAIGASIRGTINGSGTNGVNLNGGSNTWDLDLWIEGVTNGIIVGQAGTSNGPAHCRIHCPQLSSTTASLAVNAGFVFLDGIQWANPGVGGPPTELTIDSTNAANGVAVNLKSGQSFEPFSAIIPGGWSYLGRGQATLPALKAAAIKLPTSTPTYGTTVTPNLNFGQWQAVTVTNATAFTMAAPSAPPAANQTAVIVIEVFNNSGGAMGVITWNAIYNFAGFTWANPATGKHRYARFEWNGTSWVCTAVALADY